MLDETFSVIFKHRAKIVIGIQYSLFSNHCWMFVFEMSIHAGSATANTDF